MKTKKLIVNLFTDGEDESVHAGTMMASHVISTRNFQSDWNICLNKAKRKYKNEWQVSDIEEMLKDLGWRLEEVKTVEVFY